MIMKNYKLTKTYIICDVLHDLVSFADQKHPWRSVTFSKVAG